MNFTLSLEVSQESAATIASNIYECFRMLGDAIFVRMGIVETDHKEMIEELTKLEVKTRRPLQTIKNLRQLRHNINYYGYEPSMSEAEDIRDIAQSCFYPLLEKLRE